MTLNGGDQAGGATVYLIKQQQLRRTSATNVTMAAGSTSVTFDLKNQWSGVFHFFNDDFGDLWPYPEYESYSDSCFAGISSLKPEHRRWRLVLDRNVNTRRCSPPWRSWCP